MGHGWGGVAVEPDEPLDRVGVSKRPVRRSHPSIVASSKTVHSIGTLNAVRASVFRTYS